MTLRAKITLGENLFSCNFVCMQKYFRAFLCPRAFSYNVNFCLCAILTRYHFFALNIVAIHLRYSGSDML